jgi:serine/threonine-protein kinase RsbW
MKQIFDQADEWKSEDMTQGQMFKPVLRLSHSNGPYIQLELSLRSELGAISSFADSFMRFIKRCRCVPGNERQVEVALREALANAIVHGNRHDPGKQVYVSCRCETDGVSLVIRDQGGGFTASDVPDPTTLKKLDSDRGRGIHLMKTMMDEVRFERGGTVVYMHKKSAREKRITLRRSG